MPGSTWRLMAGGWWVAAGQCGKPTNKRGSKASSIPSSFTFPPSTAFRSEVGRRVPINCALARPNVDISHLRLLDGRFTTSRLTEEVRAQLASRVGLHYLL